MGGVESTFLGFWLLLLYGEWMGEMLWRGSRKSSGLMVLRAVVEFPGTGL